jgi:hypothetical protein
MRPDWFNSLTPEELPLMKALDDLVQNGEAKWL